MDEVLNTCETICNLLDRHPDIIYTKGEAWGYEQIERLDRALFRRIKRFVAAGRWEVIGGWYIQPDCNLPGEAGFKKQIELGRAYFERAFGFFPRIAYNVDSFGHTAALPELLSEAGQTHYIMMRPKKEEMTLPARLFRWRGRAGGPEIVTYRIPVSYNTPHGITLEHVEGSLTELPRGISHTMCFYGLNDHGGGPNEEMIAWCHENREKVPRATLEFSSPSRYFRAVAEENARLPLVTGELQMHAVGCYSVHRKIKLDARRAEVLLQQAENAMRENAGLAKESEREVEKAWKWTCFNQFHDTMGGTCIPSAYDQVDAQLGFAKAVGDDVLQRAMRLKTRPLPPDPRQRIILGNFSGVEFDDWVEHEPWLEWNHWQPDWALIDERDEEIPFQALDHEAVCPGMARLLFKARVEPGQLRIFRISRKKGTGMVEGKLPEFQVMRKQEGKLAMRVEAMKWNLPELELVEDTSDTWSHDTQMYTGKATGAAKWGKPRHSDKGPLMHAWCVDGRIGGSRLEAEWRRYAGEPFIELRLKINWSERFRILRLRWNPGAKILHRFDGISRGELKRESDGIERPVFNRTMLILADGGKAGVVLPDTYSLSGTEKEIRLTLLRSPLMAWGAPESPVKERRIFSDQGPQKFLLRFYPRGATAAKLEKDSAALEYRPVAADDTRGMPWRPLSHQIERPL
jgi:alpha-mannosidase